MDEISLFWKRMYEKNLSIRRPSHCQVSRFVLSTLFDVRTTMNRRLTTHFSERIPVVKRRMTV